MASPASSLDDEDDDIDIDKPSANTIAMVTPKGDGVTVLAIVITMMALSVIAVVVRVLVRVHRHAFGLDDTFMIAGLLLFLATGGCLIPVAYHGAGYLMAELSLADQSVAIKLYLVCQILYLVAATVVKASICMALYRIGGTSRVYRWILHATLALSAASTVVCCGILLGACRPLPALWYAEPGACNASANVVTAYLGSVVSILTDWALAILPFFMLHNVQMSRSVKVSVTGVLALGALASCATIVRLRFIVYYNDSAELMTAAGKVSPWCIVEVGVGIVAGSMPMMRPLLKSMFPCLHVSEYASGSGQPSGGGGGGGGGGQRSAGGKRSTTGNGGGGGGGFMRSVGRSRRDKSSGGGDDDDDDVMHLDTFATTTIIESGKQKDVIEITDGHYRNGGGAGPPRRQSSGESQRHILKEEVYTVTSEPNPSAPRKGSYGDSDDDRGFR